MGRYAYFMCSDCKVGIWLGKAVFHTSGEKRDKVKYYHIGQEDEPFNWERDGLNRVIWKMLADHAEHNLRVVVEYGPLYTDDVFDDFTKIGGDEIGDISFAEYLRFC